MSLISFFSSVDEKFVRQNFKDPGEAEKFIARYAKKAKFIVGILMSLMLVFFFAIGYAIVKIENAKMEVEKVAQLLEQVDQCVISSNQQMEDATAARERAEKFNQAIQVQLEDCSKTKSKK